MAVTAYRPAGEVVVAATADLIAADWRDAVRLACQPLVTAGAVTAHYPERCVSIVEQHGPYIVLAPGLAVAHARPEDGARQLCLASATLARPVAFGHPENDPVDLVLAFGSPDDTNHIGLLRTLAEHLLAGFADTLRSAPDTETARAALSRVAQDRAMNSG